MLRYFNLFFFLWGVGATFAQTPKHEFVFSTLNTFDGLSQNCVTSICQDSCGFLWFGTYDGLNLYDGYAFKIYHHTNHDSTSLSGNQIRQIVKGSNNNLWILTENGLDRLNKYTEQIKHYPLKEKIVHLHYSSRNNLLVLTSRQLYRYVAFQDTLISVLTTPHHFTTIAENQQGLLFLGTQKTGIQIYSPSFQPIKASSSILDWPAQGNISHLHTDTENRVWIIFTNQIIGKLDSLHQKFLSLPKAYYTTIDPDIRSILDFDSLRLLIGTFNGLFFLDKNTGQVTPTNSAIGQKGELSHFSIRSLYKDHQGTLWVGTNSGGVNYYSVYNNRFNFILPSQFSGLIGMGREDPKGRLWFATEGGGLLCYDPVTRHQQNFLLNTDVRQAFNNNIIKAVHISGDSIFCTTHRGEVYLFSISTGQFKLMYDFKYNNILCIFKDTCGNMWIATNTGRGLIQLKEGELIDKFQINGQYKHLNQVTTIIETTPGELLFGSVNGIYYYNLHSNKLSEISAQKLHLPADTPIEVTAFLKDSQKNIWIATAKNGLFILNQKLEYIQSLSQLTAPEEKILSIAESPTGQFWFTTNRKLYRYQPGENTCNYFDVSNGMPSQEFSTNSVLAAKDGRLYLPGNKGITTLNTFQFPINPEIPPLWLTTLRINNRKVIPRSDRSVLSRPLSYTPAITLHPDETNIAIGYTAINYIHPLSNRYAYYLEGIDPDWIQAKGNREAIYNNLPPGIYTFHLKASNNDGIWNNNGPALRIHVPAPLWQRWWAYLIYALILFTAIRQYFIYRQKKLTLEHELHFTQLQQEQSEKIHQERLRFFTQIAHEFRTPLTLILNPLDELSQKTIHISGTKEAIKLIRKNTQRLLSLTNNLLNIQQLETGKSKLHPIAFDFYEFMQELYYTFQATAQNRNIQFRLEMKKSCLPVLYDRDELEKAIFNLLSNAFKFTPSGGTVTLSARLSSSEPANDIPASPMTCLLIEIKDNGIGIHPEDKDKLFEPFSISHKDLHDEIPGSGIGLSIVHTIVKQHRGTLCLRDALPQGTIASIQLPYTPAPLTTETLPGITPEKEEVGPQQPVSSNHRPYTLLLIDDNPEILSYLSAQLEHNYKIFTAKNGKEALDIATHKTINLIISDIVMPVMDGTELCRLIKSSPELCHIPVILLTAKAMTMHVEEGFYAGADDYLIKPFKISALKARIYNILQERERLKEIYSKKLSLKSAGIEIEPIDKNFMEKYITTVRQNIANPDFSIDALCQLMGMSRAAFYRKIKAVTTLSPAEMIRNIRLECAAELLKTTTLTASEVAFQVGFGSYAHFSNYFKAVYGVSPKEFKEK